MKKARVVDENISIWTTNFPKLLKLTKKERQLNPNVLITYKRPQTIATLLTNYKILGNKNSVVIGGSFPCGKCVLCNRGREGGMVKKTSSINLKNGRAVKLKKHLNCKNFGVYVAKCNVCDEHYVGQTITSFSQRWCSHRHNWKNMTNSETNDRAALKLHYTNKHPTSNKNFEEAYSFIFIDSTNNLTNLDYLESK